MKSYEYFLYLKDFSTMLFLFDWRSVKVCKGLMRHSYYVGMPLR